MTQSNKSTSSRTTKAAPGGSSDQPTQATPAPGGQKAPAQLAKIAPGNFPTDALMGVQLTEQYLKAKAGAIEVLRFGAMMLMLRDHLAALPQEKHSGRGRYAAGSGVKGWLAKHAKDVPEASAHRFLHVAQSVEASFPTPKGITFVKLATTPREQLAPKFRTKQDALWAFVSGTSKQSWLDQFKPALPAGGAQVSSTPELSAEEKYKAAVKQAREDGIKTFAVLGSLTNRNAFQVLPEKELHLAIDTAEAFLAKAKAWIEIPKTQRTADFQLD